MKKQGIFLLLIFITILSCKKETFYTDSNVTLKFSYDTISFDTIFTTFGSITKRLMVYNPYSDPVKISSVSLAGSDQSPFVLNINGSDKLANDVIIEAKDSLYIFIQLLLQPTGNDLPLFVKDSVLFTTNGRQQDVKLIAYAQDAFLLSDSTIQTQTWSGNKPYLVYGDLTLDSANTLYINPGVKVYMHRDANFFIKGNIQATGTFNEPIFFKQDRLDKDYKDIPGQWGGIYVLPGTGSQKLDWVIIENGTTGLQLGSGNNTQGITIDLSNVIIRNMAYACLLAYNSTVYGSNCLIANSRIHTCTFLGGGTYQFYHSTLVNYYGKYDTRKNNFPLLKISNYLEKENEEGNFNFYDLTSSYFRNCIIYGSYSDELILDFKDEALSEITFDNCVIRKYNNYSDDKYTDVYWNKDPKFLDGVELNFELDTLSSAIDKGNPSWGSQVPYDLKNVYRFNDEGPDIGAYERKEKE